MKNSRICKRCVLPESEPNIRLNENGLCNICEGFDKNSATRNVEKALETDFIKIINKNKGRGRYDCLVMCSGGKDSTSSLYYMCERYKLNPLAFTFDHGFETEEALENIRNAVELLGVDFLYFKSNYMKEMFSRILKTGSKAVICHPCSIWYMDLAFEIAAKYGIPMIVAGWTKGQSTRQEVMSKCGCNIHAPEFADMSKATIEFLKTELKGMEKYRDFPLSMEEVLKRAQKKHKCIVVSPHWFLPFGEDIYVKTIMKELNWKFPEISYPKKSTNCYLNFISVHNSVKHFGYTHYHVEMSKHIREGLMTRDEAVNNLRIDFDRNFLNKIAQKLDFQF
jgi:diphthamide synthase (EF-2-diphthine--ammonia ligase)